MKHMFSFLRLSPTLSAVALFLVFSTAAFAASAKGVQVVPNEAQRRVDITIDGATFTSYIWPTTLKKPVLYPLIDGDGITVTRGYPLEPRPGERADHPHHAGLWFNYAKVNGFDFWNNSEAIKPENRAKMGTIVHTKIVSAKSGSKSGELVVESTWITGENQQILTQTTRYIFSLRNGARVIDQDVSLKALGHVVFADEKDGLLGLRVARWLESPDEKGGIFMDSNGNPTKVDAVPTDAATPATGVYLTSEGAKGGAAWGTRGRWCSLTGHTGNHTATIAIFDQPNNPAYPTFWHARGYGLFALNPLAPSVFDAKHSPLNLTLEKGQSINFRYRVMLYSRTATPDELNRESNTFQADSK